MATLKLSYKLKSRGSSVKHFKDELVALGYLHASTHDRFGHDTDQAVRAFQLDHKLKVDGVIGPQTGPAIDAAYAKLGGPVVPPPEPKLWTLPLRQRGYTLTPEVEDKIARAIADTNPKIREVIIEGLNWVYPYGIYEIGANLYTKKLELDVPTEAALRAHARKEPSWFNGGRLDFMIKAVKDAIAAVRKLVRADCSGLRVGLYRITKLKSAGYDQTADGLYHADKHITKADLMPGDGVYRESGGKMVHTALYVGAGYCLEAVGGSYGIQITKLDDRLVYDYNNGGRDRMKPWTHFGRPTVYK